MKFFLKLTMVLWISEKKGFHAPSRIRSISFWSNFFCTSQLCSWSSNVLIQKNLLDKDLKSPKRYPSTHFFSSDFNFICSLAFVNYLKNIFYRLCVVQSLLSLNSQRRADGKKRVEKDLPLRSDRSTSLSLRRLLHYFSPVKSRKFSYWTRHELMMVSHGV